MNIAQEVHRILTDCLFRNEEITTPGELPEGGIQVDAIVMDMGLHPGRIQEHREEIRSLLNEMPTEFHRNGGGGMSFLNLCVDKNGVHWGEHQSMANLIALGIAAGMAKYLFPRVMWHQLPGGMPYVVFDTTS